MTAVSKRDTQKRELAKRMFDLPDNARSPCELEAWCKALENRNFQDKFTRVFQYGFRALAYYILKADPKSDLGKRMNKLVGQLSLSRKAFRALLWVSNFYTAWNAFKAMIANTEQGKGLIKVLSTVQWVTFSYSIVWDNVVFLSHPAVGFLNHPQSLWFSANAAKDIMVNWRSRSDFIATCASLLEYLHARRKRDVLKDKVAPAGASTDGQNAANAEVVAAEAKCRAALYPLAKYFGDVATYLPQAKWAAAGPWHSTKGFHDGYMGICGTLVALIGCRSEWLKMK